MPKSSSKKKKEKNADFKKTKLKVGKKKAVADNFTDTSFKSKSISLPTQSISQDKSTLLTNSRNVTFSELMTQLKHYSPGTRKDAILGLKDLFHRHPHLLPLHLGTLVNAIVRLLIDDSSVVRKALQTFLSEFTPMLHPRDIHPFLPLLIVYTCSAMTHILEDIREDALKFMDLWVAAGGQVVVNGFWDKILPNYVALLTSDSNASHASKLSSAMSFSAAAPTASQSAGNKGSSSSSGKGGSLGSSGSSGPTSKNAFSSLKAKCSVLESLAGFLETGLGSERGDSGSGSSIEKDPYWFLRNFLGTEQARRSFNLARTTISGNEGLGRSAGRQKTKKKRKSDHSGGGGGEGRSIKKHKTGEDEEEDEESDDDSDKSESSEESEESEDEEDEDEPISKSDAILSMAPVVSFASAHRHHHPMATSPLNPTILQSDLVQSLFGDTSQSLQGSPSIPIRVFPQQGVASAVGAGASASSSNNSKTTTSGASTVQSRVAGVKQLISTLHPLLLSVWLDMAPNVFESSSTPNAGPALEMAHLILRIWNVLWRAALARPKTDVASDEAQEREQAKQEEKWMDDALQSMLKHVLIYFPFGKDSVGMMDAKVASTLHEMNTLHCELLSLFLLASGSGKVRKVSLSMLKQQKKAVALEHLSKQQPPSSNKGKYEQSKSSYRPSNKTAKQQAKKAAMVIESSDDDYDSEEEELQARSGKDGIVYVQQEAPEWVDQVVDFVLDTLGYVKPEHDDNDADTDEPTTSQLTTRSSDFTPKHLVALLPTLWTLLNCLETKRREWVFEALMNVFNESHHQSGVKRAILEFLSLIIKLQSHPHYTGTFTLMIPGARAVTNNKALSSLRSVDKKAQEESIRTLSAMLSKSLLKLPKMLWDLGAERPETSLAVLDLLAWIVTVAGDAHAGAADEKERVQFLQTLQNYMALFFSATVGGKNGQEKRLVLGPFSKLPLALQRRAVEIVYYSSPNVAAASVKTMPLMMAVQKCCQAADLSEETRLYIKETLCIQ